MAAASTKTFHMQPQSTDNKIQMKYDPETGLRTAAILASCLLVVLVYILYKTKCQRTDWTEHDRLFIERYKKKLQEQCSVGDDEGVVDVAGAPAETRHAVKTCLTTLQPNVRTLTETANWIKNNPGLDNAAVTTGERGACDGGGVRRTKKDENSLKEVVVNLDSTGIEKAIDVGQGCVEACRTVSGRKANLVNVPSSFSPAAAAEVDVDARVSSPRTYSSTGDKLTNVETSELSEAVNISPTPTGICSSHVCPRATTVCSTSKGRQRGAELSGCRNELNVLRSPQYGGTAVLRVFGSICVDSGRDKRTETTVERDPVMDQWTRRPWTNKTSSAVNAIVEIEL